MKVMQVNQVNKFKNMNIKRLAVVICGLGLSGLTGCTNMSAGQKNYMHPATPVVIKPVVMSTQPTRQDFRLVYGNSIALSKAYQQYLRTGKASNVITDGFEQFAFGESQPVIAASPFELTVITLQQGENVTNVSSGDPTRWSYSLAYSGQGKDRQAHVMIKPSFPNTSTNFVITSDKRMYTLKLVSGALGAKYLKDVRFWYPDEIQAYWDNYNAEQEKESDGTDKSGTIANMPNISVDKMNFAYNISTKLFSSPAWKPVRAFDDGTHTYIQFPDGISSKNMPALFVINGDKQALVNYRYKQPYFVVDKIFDQAVLLEGVGNNQTRVVITNNRYN